MRCIRGDGRLVVCATRNTRTTRFARQEASSLHTSTKRTDKTEIGASYTIQVDDLRSSRTCMPHGPQPAWASNVSQVDLTNLVCISPESMFGMNSSRLFETTASLLPTPNLDSLVDQRVCCPRSPCMPVLASPRTCDIRRSTCWLSTTCASLRLIVRVSCSFLRPEAVVALLLYRRQIIRICVPEASPTFDGYTVGPLVAPASITASYVSSAKC